MTGQLLQAAIPGGVQALINELRTAFGEAEQLAATKALENLSTRGADPFQCRSGVWIGS